MGIVRFNYADVKPITLRNKTAVKKAVFDLFVAEGKPLSEINYVFCSDSYLVQINRSFLQHDYFTDIITFDLSDGDETVGEVYISVDTVKANAADHLVTFQEELLRVIFHGALHLCGYKDKKKSEEINATSPDQQTAPPTEKTKRKKRTRKSDVQSGNAQQQEMPAAPEVNSKKEKRSKKKKATLPEQQQPQMQQ